MNNKLLLVFVKNLIPGMVKTRLAKDIGIDGALDVYMELVRHTNEVVEKVVRENRKFGAIVRLKGKYPGGDLNPHDLAVNGFSSSRSFRCRQPINYLR